MDDLLMKYADQFHENFPLFIVRDMTEKEIKDTIQKCLDENKPYAVKTDSEHFY